MVVDRPVTLIVSIYYLYKNIFWEIIYEQMFAFEILEKLLRIVYYIVDTTLIGGIKSGSEDSSFNIILMCVSFFYVPRGTWN